MRIGYFTHKALLSIKESFGITMLTSLTISLTLLVVGSYILILQNLEQFSLVWGRSASITAYVADGVTQSQWESVRIDIRELRGIQEATLIKPETALEAFKERGPEAARLIQGISPEILPASIHIELEGSFANLSEIERIAGVIQSAPAIESVDYGKEEFQQLERFLEVLRYAGVLAGILLGIATILIVSNTIRLTVYSRRDEISILQLVGATNSFVRIPFLIEGCLWGLLAGLITWVTFWGAQTLLVPQITAWASQTLGGLTIHLYDPTLCIILLGTGLILGGVGSSLAVSRFLLAGNQP